MELFTGYVDMKSYLTVINFDCPDVSAAKAEYCSSYIIEMRIQIISHSQQIEECEEMWFDSEKNQL